MQGQSSVPGTYGRCRRCRLRSICERRHLLLSGVIKMQSLGAKMGATQANVSLRQANRYGQAAGDHASWRTGPDHAERLTGIYGSEGACNETLAGARDLAGIIAGTIAGPPCSHPAPRQDHGFRGCLRARVSPIRGRHHSGMRSIGRTARTWGLLPVSTATWPGVSRSDTLQRR